VPQPELEGPVSASARPYVSVVIVMAADKFVTLSPPLDRVGSVTFGSMVGAGVSLLTERLESFWTERMAKQTTD
jgi:hypothetical protein